MKTRAISLLLALSLIAGVFYACKKYQEKDDTKATQTELTDADRAVAGRILEFRQRLELKKTDPTFKSSEIISIDDARLDVETNFNAYFAFPDEKYFIQSMIRLFLPCESMMNQPPQLIIC